MTACPQCGNALASADYFCSRCGCYAAKEPRSNAGSDTVQTLSSQSRLVFILMGLFLGTLGVHNFYIGRTKQGIIQLLITLVSGGTLALVSFCWAIFDICVITRDSKGQRLA